MGLKDLFRRAQPEPEERESWPTLSLGQFAQYLGNAYPLMGMSNASANREEIGPGLEGLAWALQGNGPALACLALRIRIFSDIRFQFREIVNGRPGKLKGAVDGKNPASTGLALLQTPEPGLTTGDLLARMIQDADHAGNAFVLRRNGRLRRLRPDWMTIVMRVPNEPDSIAWDLDAELIGYMYQPGGAGHPAVPLLPEEVAHWAPLPDPTTVRRGTSWVNSILREVTADTSATRHEGQFFDNDATVNQQLVFEPGITKEVFEEAKLAFKENHQGIDNAYKTLYVLGAELKPVGLNFKDMDFTNLQGRFETRIAAASGVGPVLTFLSEGLQGSALNAGNFESARRAVADMTFRPLWRSACGALSNIIETPTSHELWFDDQDVMFLQSDRKSAAEIQQVLAQTIANLVKEGFESDSAVDAVMSEDMTLLKHSGLVSVQLQPPGSPNSGSPNAPSNGNGQLSLPVPGGSGS